MIVIWIAVAVILLGLGFTLIVGYGFNSSKQCFDGIMWGDNNSVGLPKNLTAYCSSPSLPQCVMADHIKYFNTFPNDTEFVVYTNVSHKGFYHGMIRVGIPGELGYRCQFEVDGNAMIEYRFKVGEIKLEDEFYTCVDNLDTGRNNCEVHKYTWRKNPEVIDLLLKQGFG